MESNWSGLWNLSIAKALLTSNLGEQLKYLYPLRGPIPWPSPHYHYARDIPVTTFSTIRDINNRSDLLPPVFNNAEMLARYADGLRSATGIQPPKNAIGNDRRLGSRHLEIEETRN
jgi:hypothetical protein